jgi:hypothetical protein
MELLERGRSQATDHLAAMTLGLDEPGHAKDAQVPADERLRQPDPGRKLSHGEWSTLRHETDNAQSRLIPERSVERPQTPQILLCRSVGR